MKVIIPKYLMGNPIEGSLERALADTPATPPNPPAQPASRTPPTPAQRVANPGDYIILEGRTHGTGKSAYTYPDTLVGMGTKHQGKNWSDSHIALAQEGNYMLSIRQFVDFLSLIKSGNAYDGLGKKVASSKLASILDDIVTVRAPYRSEWLDADFKVQEKLKIFKGKILMNYEHTIVNGKPDPQRPNEILEGYLAKDKTIDFDDWLARATYQGLPPPDIKDGSLYYWKPLKDNNSVAWFVANSGRTGLDCDGDPTNTDSSLGVRPARKKI